MAGAADVLCADQKLMLDALYWTASTIAQVLAGGMGILAAFALYRLSRASDSLGILARAIDAAILADYEAKKTNPETMKPGPCIESAKKLYNELQDPISNRDWDRIHALCEQHGPDDYQCMTDSTQDYWQEEQKRLDSIYKRFTTPAQKFYLENNTRRGVVLWLWIAVLSSAGGICLALALLSFAGLLVRSAFWAWVCMAAVVAGAAWCLFSFVWLIRRALQ